MPERPPAKPARRPARLSVCMIVRDEQAVLARCLDSLQGIHDELCVVDTGSRDDTVAIAERYGARVQRYAGCNGPDGRIADFAAARNQALAMASGDWVLQIDADEVLRQGHAQIKRHVRSAHPGMIGVGLSSNGAHWVSARLFRRTPDAHYRSRIHEYLVQGGGLLPDKRIRIENLENKQGKESASERNIRLCLLALAERPDEARTLHYLANEYRESQRFDEAIACYRQALALGNFPIGRFHSAYYLAVCHLLKEEWDQAMDYALLAIRADPRYAEGPCLVADIYSSTGQREYAAHWYRMALVCKRPPADAVLGVQHWAYGDYPRQRLARLAAA
ncbi:glycosyltransferase [Chromobacterium subtsugae]|uniref:glycosyltransferase n=1 Tax=Chromobacterium subtsugae TaxID=251747 RepID=UPI00096BE9D5|nr:glycosyltransferase [Chromobacterium subtsugae]